MTEKMLFFRQVFVLSANDMTRLRGALMIIVMKLISLGFDLDSASVAELPIVVDYFSYIFSVSTVIFGPWLSFKQHKNLFEQKDFKVNFKRENVFLPFIFRQDEFYV